MDNNLAWLILTSINAIIAFLSLFFILIVYSYRFKKAAILIIFLITFPLLGSSLFDFIFYFWIAGWWAVTVGKSLRYKKVSYKELNNSGFLHNYIRYITIFAGLMVAVESVVSMLDFIYYLISGADAFEKIKHGSIIEYSFQIFTLIFFTFLLSRRGRTFIEDVAGIAVTAKEGGRLSFFRSLFRYLLILVTFPFGFGLINFISKEPLYNKWSGAVEYKNENQAVKDGWLYRQVVAAGKKSNATKTS